MEIVATEAGFEFPMINYLRVTGLPYRYIWDSDLSCIVKIDKATEDSRRCSRDAITFGEPVFVGRSGAIDDDDGVLLTVGSCTTKPEREMTVWDAHTWDVLARIIVPVAIPLGFHGAFETR